MKNSRNIIADKRAVAPDRTLGAVGASMGGKVSDGASRGRVRVRDPVRLAGRGVRGPDARPRDDRAQRGKLGILWRAPDTTPSAIAVASPLDSLPRPSAHPLPTKRTMTRETRSDILGAGAARAMLASRAGRSTRRGERAGIGRPEQMEVPLAEALKAD
jgi:hypothetical protein